MFEEADLSTISKHSLPNSISGTQTTFRARLTAFKSRTKSHLTSSLCEYLWLGSSSPDLLEYIVVHQVISVT